jgi:tetratricopeptide (TPR) repeat protein
MNITCKARGSEIPKQAQRIFLSYHGCNTAERDAIISDLHSTDVGASCLVLYLENPCDIDENKLSNEISEAKVLIIWDTSEILEDAMSGKLPLEYYVAKKEKKPIIPILRYDCPFETFKKVFGDTHCISKPYDDKFDDEQNKEYKTSLKAQLDKFLVPDEIIKLINAKAFTGSIFVGYRKHEREEARRFMKAFHDLEGCVSISIRYDNFLTAGKNFNNEIKEIITDKNTLALALVVTPDLATKNNYVQRIEYPLAQEIGKPVVPIEVKRTPYSQFVECFPGAGMPIPLEDTISLQATMHRELGKTAFVKDLDNERAYLLGMAFLMSINVERDFDRAVRLLADATEDYTEASANAVEQLANIYENGIWTNINYYEALKWYQKALIINEKVFGKEHPNIVNIYNNIAVVYQKQGMYPKALEWYDKALAVNEEILGKEHPDTATIYNNFAFVYYSQGEYSEASEWYHKALVISEKMPGKEHPDTATIYNNIALVCDGQGDYLEALEWHQKALAISEKILGKEHPDTATTYNNIANINQKQGEYEKALDWYKKALIIHKKIQGDIHPDTAGTYNNMALAYNNLGEYHKALKLYDKALEIHLKVLGKDHPSIAVTYNNIADTYLNQGKYSKAFEWHYKALEIREKVLGKHPLTAITYNNIALVYYSQGMNSEALEWCQKALEIRIEILGNEHHDTAMSYNSIAAIYQNQEKYSEALKLYQKALKIKKKTLDKEHPDIAVMYNNIATVYQVQKEYEKAMEYFQKALKIREKKLGKEHALTAITYNNIAVVYYRQGEYAKALEWYDKALVINEKVLGKDHPSTITTYNNIAVIHKKCRA